MIKKVLVSLCVLPLLLTACSKDEVIAPVADSGKAISFGTVLAPASRGAEVNKTQLQATGYGFRVSAYNQGNVVTSWNDYLTNVLPDAPNFMDNKDVTWNSTTSAWTYSPVKFWPGIVSGGDYGHVTFFALGGLLSGVPAIAYTGTDKAPKFVHTTDPVAANQVDLVAAVNFDEYWVANKTVNFQFKHILSKIGFQAKLADNYSTLYGATVMVKVTSLKVKYANNAVIKGADYHFNTDSDTPTTPGNWQTAGTTKFTDNANSGELIPEDLVSANDGVEVTSTSTAVPLNEADKYLMLIPQTTGADGDLTVELEYQVTTDKDTAAEKTETYKGSYAIPARPYAIGTAYTYTFNIELRAVVFVVLDGEVGVSSWGNPETVDQPADIPVQ